MEKRGPSTLSRALEQNSYADAKKMLKDFEQWLRQLNESAADSLGEALEEILTVHRLKVPALLRKTRHSTNPIESMFAMVSERERHIERYRGGAMSQRWLGTVLSHAEQGFRTIKGYQEIAAVMATIELEQAETRKAKAA